MILLAAVLAAVATAVAGAAPARAQTPCLTAEPPAPDRAPVGLRFGITPGSAGSAGGAQGTVARRDEPALTRALTGLRPRGRQLVLRLNRLFWADGTRGIRRFARLVDRYAAAGLRSEIQVRYHPPPGRAGDLPAWRAFVRRAVRALGRKPAVVGFSITNEANLPISPNTSDGTYPGVVGALVDGVVVARRELVALGRPRLAVGFNVMWRWLPGSDADFWARVGARATPAFRRALDYVGVQVYPGLVWPPGPLQPGAAGADVLEALTLERACYLPIAGLGREVALWVSENGYPTNPGRGTEAGQAAALRDTVGVVHRWSGTLGVTDYRWFNLRDNDSGGDELFAAVGLLRDDHTRKPAYAAMRRLIARTGAVRRRGPG